jgi:hypothetical protein
VQELHTNASQRHIHQMSDCENRSESQIVRSLQDIHQSDLSTISAPRLCIMNNVFGTCFLESHSHQHTQ